MIFAELHGKISSTYENATDRSEDLLTSTVFGLLRYIPAKTGIVEVLKRAKIVRFDRSTFRLTIDPTNFFSWDKVDGISFTVEFWPSFSGYGEPDVIVTFTDGNGTQLACVLIEAKLFSQKSGSAKAGEPEADEAVPDADQLVKYWHGWKQRGASTPRLLVYLTAHGAPPIAELKESLIREPGLQLAWLSWSEVWRVLQSIPQSQPCWVIANDLARLLSRKGLRSFDGFHCVVAALPSSGRFRTSALWFDTMRADVELFFPTANGSFFSGESMSSFSSVNVPARPLGPSVKAAMKFLSEFHDDVYQLIKRLDAHLAEYRWMVAPDMGSRVTSGLGASLEAREWIIPSVSRLYVEQDTFERDRVVLLVSLRLAPTTFNEPICLVAVGVFPPKHPAKAIWDEWAQSAPVLELL